jgi:hypothetical protein
MAAAASSSISVPLGSIAEIERTDTLGAETGSWFTGGRPIFEALEFETLASDAVDAGLTRWYMRPIAIPAINPSRTGHIDKTTRFVVIQNPLWRGQCGCPP